MLKLDRTRTEERLKQANLFHRRTPSKITLKSNASPDLMPKFNYKKKFINVDPKLKGIKDYFNPENVDTDIRKLFNCHNHT